MKYSLICGLWSSIVDAITGIFALIPQYIYFIYTCCASFLDFIQFVSRKLIGLDSYYVNGTEKTGDIVQDFIGGILGIGGGAEYSTLSTVFWSMMVFGLLVLILSTIFQIVKSHYNYDADKSHPMKIVFNSIKSLSLMAIIPLVSLFGIMISNLLLGVVDNVTSPGSTSQIADTFETSSVDYSTFFKDSNSERATQGIEQLFNRGDNNSGYTTYSSYDIFGFGAYTNSVTFSGVMFDVACRNASRVRYGSYTASKTTTGKPGSNDDLIENGGIDENTKFLWSDFGIFTSDVDDEDERTENVANMIDYAFANNLTMVERQTPSLLGKESWPLVSSYAYLESAVWRLGTIQFSSFSKYNVGLVWYYYNLWAFNFFIAFAGAIFCVTLFTSIMFGLALRMFELVGLFLVFPALVGVSPLDDGSAIKQWKEKFIANILMGYGAIVGMNLSFMFMNEINSINFFDSPVLNGIVDMLIIISVLMVAKDLMKMFSGFIKAKDANETGEGAKKEMKAPVEKATQVAMKSAQIALKASGIGAAAGVAMKKGMEMLEKRKAAKVAAQMATEKNPDYKDLDALKNQKDADEQDMIEKNKQLDDDKNAYRKMLEENQNTLTSTKAKKAQKDFKDNHKGSGEELKNFKNSIYENNRIIDKMKDKTSIERQNMKKEFKQNLIEKTISDFEKNSTVGKEAEEARDKFSTSSHEYEEQKDAQEKRKTELMGKKKERTGTGKIMTDIAGQTFKLVGKLTGASSMWKSMDDSGVADEAKKTAQVFFKTFNAYGQNAKVAQGTSKLLTKKQKDDNKKKELQAYRDKMREESSLQNSMLLEMKNFAEGLQRLVYEKSLPDIRTKNDKDTVEKRVEMISKFYKSTLLRNFTFKEIEEIKKLSSDLENPYILSNYKTFIKDVTTKNVEIDKKFANLSKNERDQKKLAFKKQKVKQVIEKFKNNGGK